MNPIKHPLAFAALPFVFAACSTVGSPGAPEAARTLEVPAAIAVPSGNKLAVTLNASGLQTYECRVKAEAAGGYDWILVGPEAAMRDKGALVGRHYGGPTWEYGDGSKVVGKILSTAPSPIPGNLPWVLLQAAPDAQPGEFAKVTYIQRTNTSGGTAPSDTCSASMIGTKKAIKYTADYSFYKS